MHKIDPETGAVPELQPKIRAIYEAVRAVYDVCGSFSQIRVSQVAAKSGIPKGTIYEYFSSKNEIIIQAVCYLVCQETENLLHRLEPAASFRDLIYELFTWIEEGIRNRLLIFQFLQPGEAGGEIRNMMSEENMQPCGRAPVYQKVIDYIYEMGTKEGVLKKDVCRFVKNCAVTNAVFNLYLYFMRREDYPGLSEDDAKEHVYRALVNTVNG